MKREQSCGYSRLRALVDQVEQFLLEQVSRLEQASTAIEAGETTSASLAEAREFAEQRERWEAERRRERARLESEAARLIEAWQRLEAEQRRLVTAGGGRISADSANATGRRTAQTASSANRNVSELLGPVPLMDKGDRREPGFPGRAVAGSPSASTASQVCAEDPSPLDEPLSAELAALQFQQMRREMQRHRCRS